MPVSKIIEYNYISDMEVGGFASGYFTSEMEEAIYEFYEGLPDIVQNRKSFLSELLGRFCKSFSDKDQLEDYFKYITRILDSVIESIDKIKKDILATKDKIRVTEIQCDFIGECAIVVFSNNSKVVFNPRLLEDEKAYNDIIFWFNSKVDKEHKLYMRKLVLCERYTFAEYMESLECSKEELDKYYFHSGQFLALLYMLRGKNLKCSNILPIYKHPVPVNLEGSFISGEKVSNGDLSSSSIAQDILDRSVYSIEFLPENKKPLNKNQINYIKSGFEYMYRVMVNNKVELIALLQKVFCRNSFYLSQLLANTYGLNDGDLKRQMFILGVRFCGKENVKTPITFSQDSVCNRLKKESILDLAAKLGDHIIQKSIIGFKNLTTSRTWISSIRGDREYIPSASCRDLYEGSSGIALFFLYLGVVTKKEYFINTAIEAMQDSIFSINNPNCEREMKVGGFKGIGGELYTLSKIYSITKDEYIKETIRKGILQLKELVGEEEDTSILGGAAGTIAILISIYENEDFSDIKDKVLDTARLAYKNIASSIKAVKSETGFGCGSSGIIAALARLFAITKDKAIEADIKSLLNFERRVNHSEKIYSTPGWYKGYPGMLLSRLALKKIDYKDALINSEIEEALAKTIIGGFGNSPYYYNGDIGNLEILEYAAEVLEDNSLKIRCSNTFNKLLEKVIEPFIKDEISCGNKSVSLMEGIVGHGYSLIRRCSNFIVPQVLWLQ